MLSELMKGMLTEEMKGTLSESHKGVLSESPNVADGVARARVPEGHAVRVTEGRAVRVGEPALPARPAAGSVRVQQSKF